MPMLNNQNNYFLPRKMLEKTKGKKIKERKIPRKRHPRGKQGRTEGKKEGGRSGQKQRKGRKEGICMDPQNCFTKERRLYS